jgi:hypothetical protein
VTSFAAVVPRRIENASPDEQLHIGEPRGISRLRIAATQRPE